MEIESAGGVVLLMFWFVLQVCFWIIFGLFLVVFGSVWVKIVKAKQTFRSGANNFENTFTNLVFNFDLEINFRQKTNQKRTKTNKLKGTES